MLRQRPLNTGFVQQSSRGRDPYGVLLVRWLPVLTLANLLGAVIGYATYAIVDWGMSANLAETVGVIIGIGAQLLVIANFAPYVADR